MAQGNPAITIEEYQLGCDEYWGICLNCHEIQHGGVEPDARNYRCESCGEDQVFGLEELIVMGRLDIKEEG